MKCQQCDKEFKAERTTAKYCSDTCRKLAFLNNKVSVPIVSVPTETEVSVLTPFSTKVGSEICHGCGVKVIRLCCICADCI